jgi:DNA-damage-inducible protein J
MPAEALIETHIGETVRLKAAAAFATAGLTIDESHPPPASESSRSANRSSGTLYPNAETLAAMEELRNGGGKSFNSVADLIADLHADD